MHGVQWITYIFLWRTLKYIYTLWNFQFPLPCAVKYTTICVAYSGIHTHILWRILVRSVSLYTIRSENFFLNFDLNNIEG